MPTRAHKTPTERHADRPDDGGDDRADDVVEAATDPHDDQEADDGSPVPVMCFHAADPTGAGGVTGDVATLAAMGAHALPVTTTILIRDSAEVVDHHALDADVIVEQARHVLEDITVSGWKIGFLGTPEGVSAVAEILSDYPDLPAVTYAGSLGWLDEDQAVPYTDAFRDLILPATTVLVGSHAVLAELLLPDWESERPPSARELAVAAGERGCPYVLVTGILLPQRGAEQSIDNVLASPQGAISGEKFEMFDAAFVGAGDTLSGALAALLAMGAELQAAVAEALQFMDQALDAGFRPGMGNVIPDRFFWALPPPDDEAEQQQAAGEAAAHGGVTPHWREAGRTAADETDDDAEAPRPSKSPPRRMH